MMVTWGSLLNAMRRDRRRLLRARRRLKIASGVIIAAGIAGLYGIGWMTHFWAWWSLPTTVVLMFFIAGCGFELVVLVCMLQDIGVALRRLDANKTELTHE